MIRCEFPSNSRLGLLDCRDLTEDANAIDLTSIRLDPVYARKM